MYQIWSDGSVATELPQEAKQRFIRPYSLRAPRIMNSGERLLDLKLQLSARVKELQFLCAWLRAFVKQDFRSEFNPANVCYRILEFFATSRSQEMFRFNLNRIESDITPSGQRCDLLGGVSLFAVGDAVFPGGAVICVHKGENERVLKRIRDQPGKQQDSDRACP